MATIGARDWVASNFTVVDNFVERKILSTRPFFSTLVEGGEGAATEAVIFEARIPANTVKFGDAIRFEYSGKNEPDDISNTMTFRIRYGTTSGTADGNIAFLTPAMTMIADEAMWMRSTHQYNQGVSTLPFLRCNATLVGAGQSGAAATAAATNRHLQNLRTLTLTTLPDFTVDQFFQFTTQWSGSGVQFASYYAMLEILKHDTEYLIPFRQVT